MKRKKWKAKMRSEGLRSARFVRLPSIVLAYSFFLGLASPPLLAGPASDKLKPTDPYALIFGTVWGPDDHPVYGIKVKIRRLPDKKAKWELYSDHAGEFAQRVAAGKADYEVSADLKGVKTNEGQPLHMAQPLAVHVEYDERVDIGLHLTK